MPHIRQRIREAAELRLAGLATTGDRVFKHHRALAAGDYPALRVTTWNETAELHAMGRPPVLMRTIDLVVEAWATGGDDLEDVLDTIAAEVEAAVAADDTFGGLAEDATLASTEKDMDQQGRKRAGVLVLTFRVRARTRTIAPDVPV